MNCPKCGETMVSAAQDGVPMVRCTGCEGRWANAGALAALAGTGEDLRSRFAEREATAYRCPAGCDAHLAQARYSEMDERLLLDVCPECAGIYLDASELQRVLEINARIRDLFGVGTFERPTGGRRLRRWLGRLMG